MDEIITQDRLEKLLEMFIGENPMGDTRDLAKWFFLKGYKEGKNDALRDTSKRILRTM